MPEERTAPLLTIDEYDLVGECTKLPGMYQQYAEQLAEAKRQYEDAKAHLEATKASIARDVRNCPADYDVGKITEAVVAEVVATSGRTKQATMDLNGAKYRVDLLTATVNTLEHKRRLIEGLISLHGQSYFSGTVRPKTKEEQDGLNEAMAAGTSAKVLAARNAN